MISLVINFIALLALPMATNYYRFYVIFEFFTLHTTSIYKSIRTEIYQKIKIRWNKK